MPISGHTSDDAVIVTMVVGSVLGAFATAARLFTRGFIVHNAGWDDLFICGACLISIIHTVVTCKRVEYGMGDKQRTLSEREMTQAYFWFWISIWVYYAGLFCVKTSILLQYLRIFVQKKFRAACYVLIAVVVVCSLWAILSGFFMCVPVKSFWDHSVVGKCLDRLAVTYSTAIINVLTDFATALLPLPLIKTLPIPKPQRMLLLAVFGIGFSTCIVSILRLVWLFPVSVAKDMTYESPLSALWSNVELNTGILCSCIPTLKSCFARLFPALFSPTTSHLPSPSHDPSRPWSPKASHLKEISTVTVSAAGSSPLTPCFPPDARKIRPTPRPLTFVSCGGVASTEDLSGPGSPDPDKALPCPPALTTLPPSARHEEDVDAEARRSRGKRNFSWPERLGFGPGGRSPGGESIRGLLRAGRESSIALQSSPRSVKMGRTERRDEDMITEVERGC